MNNINKVVKNCLCTACGTCESICPKDAITLKENIAGFLYADVNESKCIDCGLCRKSCPSDSDNVILPEDPYHGSCIKSYLAYSTNSHIRQSGQSGGLVTSLLCFLLDKHLIEGAVVNRYNPKNKRTEAFYTESRDEIIKSAGSKYTQSAVVPVILQNKNKKLAAVTLGCQSESINQLKSSGKDVSNLEYNIGLICIGQNSGHLTEKLISQFQLKAEEEEAIFAFRSKDKDVGGWPGRVCVRTSNGVYSLPKEKRLELKTVYESFRCILCYDQMNVYSDVVCGDPWGIKHEGLKSGYTVVVSRTKKGEQLLKDAEKEGYIVLEELPLEDVYKGQTLDIRQVTKVTTAKKVCAEEGWVYPYPETELFERKGDIKVDSKIKERLLYSRLYYQSTSKEMEQKLSSERHKKSIEDRKKMKKTSRLKSFIIKIKRILRIK